MRAFLAGPPASGEARSPEAEEEGEKPLTDPLRSLKSLAARASAQAAVLLGYPDQFPFLAEKEGTIPTFLWAQFSSPPRPESLGRALPVPLTPKSRAFLEQAGVPGIGPIIPHGVDGAVFRPAEGRQRLELKRAWGLEGGFVIGTVAANSPRKRLDKVIESFASFSLEREGLLLIKTDRTVSAAGLDLERLAERCGVGAKVRIMTGELGEGEMSRLYAAMDLYLTLSEWEGFGIPVIEAMACGLPVARLPVQGPGELVPYGELLIPGSRIHREGRALLLEADPRQAAATLLAASANRARLEELGRIGRRHVLERCEIRLVAQRWEELIAGTPAR